MGEREFRAGSVDWRAERSPSERRTTTHELEVNDATLVLRGEGRARECQLCRCRKVNEGPVELGATSGCQPGRARQPPRRTQGEKRTCASRSLTSASVSLGIHAEIARAGAVGAAVWPLTAGGGAGGVGERAGWAGAGDVRLWVVCACASVACMACPSLAGSSMLSCRCWRASERLVRFECARRGWSGVWLSVWQRVCAPRRVQRRRARASGLSAG